MPSSKQKHHGKRALEAVEEGTRNQERGRNEYESLSISLNLKESPSSRKRFDLPLRKDTGGRTMDRREVKPQSNDHRLSQARA
ncbi:hypothetical protein V6N13_053929 [Hibiscus sabdariffa]|uniref:Uncharacterized protein n=1 Tax=Hibiscus sabdariffa TaxID=183260 RepID=A0ABR2T654_9ROSI